MPRRAWAVLAAVSLCSFQTSLSLSVVNVAFPSLRDAFPDVRPANLSWVLNLYTIVAGASLVVAGVLGDRVGRKRILLLGAGGFVAASAACALAPNVAFLLGARVAQALASALVTPASAALIVREFPESHRGTAVALWAASGSVAAATGPSLGGVLVDWGGWPWAFWVNLPGGLLGLLIAVLVVRESRDPTPRPLPDLFGALMIMASVSMVIVGLTQSRAWGWTDTRVGVALVGGSLLAALLVRRSSRHPNPILDVSLARFPTFRLANAASVVFGVGFFSMFFGYVLFLTDVWDYRTRTAGLLMTPVPVCGVLVSPIVGRLARRFGSGRLMVPAGGAVAAGGAMLLFGSRPSAALATLWLPAMVAIGVGSAVLWPCIFTGVVSEVPQERYAVATGINQTVQRISTALGVALAITMLGPTTAGDGVGNFGRLFALTVASGLASMAIGGLFVRLERGQRFPRQADGGGRL